MNGGAPSHHPYPGDPVIAHVTYQWRSAWEPGGAGGAPTGPPSLSLPDMPWGLSAVDAWLEQVRGIYGYEGIPGLPGAVGPSIHGTGVFDAPMPSVPVLRDQPVPEWEPAASTEDVEYGPGWPDEWKKQPGDPAGWDPNQWEYPQEEEVAHDWGHLIRQGIETFTGIGQPPVFSPTPLAGGTIVGPASTMQTATLPGGPVTTNALCPPAGSCGGPRYLTYDCKTGQMSVRRRRRRRRLLTDGDKQDLGTIVAMFGKGAAAQIALAAAVKR